MTTPTLKKCPVCKARFDGDELPKQPCRRCKSDLESIRICYHQAAHYQKRARIALARGELQDATYLSTLALKLVNDPSIRQTHKATRLAGILATGRMPTSNQRSKYHISNSQ